jgi:hypothetical protein
MFKRLFLELLVGQGLGMVSKEKDAGLNRRSICRAPRASAYLAKCLSMGLAASSTAATSMSFL